jgi:hypothetical protein
MVAVHVDEGVTPMMLACRADDCRGVAMSRGYHTNPGDRARVTIEWRKATTTELKRWRREDPSMYAHCTAGGLVIGDLSDAGRDLL